MLPRMKTAHAASFALLFALAGCDRISSLLGHGDAGETSAAPGSSGATNGPAPATNAPVSLLGFEGEIDLLLKAKTSPTPISLNLLVKNDIVRFDVPTEALASKDVARVTGGGKVYGLLKASEKKLTMVLDAQHEAVFLDLDQMGDKVRAFRHRVGGAPSTSTPPEPPKVVKTGRKETVAGTTCEDWDVLSADKSKLSLCVSDQGAGFFNLPITGIPTENLWMLELLDGKHFPMRAIAFDRDGAESGRVEVTKLDKHSIDAAQVEVPAGYKQITLDEMLMGLGGATPPGDVPHDQPHDTPPPGKHGHGHHGRH